MSKKHTAGKTVVAPVAVAVMVAGVRRAVVTGAVIEGGILAVLSMLFFGLYHLLDEAQVREAVPGDLESDIQTALADLDDEDLETAGVAVADTVEDTLKHEDTTREGHE